MNNEDRVDQFEVEVARLRLKTNLRSFEKTASKLSVVLMIIAVVIGFASYVQSTNADNSLDQNELVILALACITLSIVGGVLFLWTRLVSFWRFWMLRQLHEQQAHLDRLITRDAPDPTGQFDPKVD